MCFFFPTKHSWAVFNEPTSAPFNHFVRAIVFFSAFLTHNNLLIVHNKGKKTMATEVNINQTLILASCSLQGEVKGSLRLELKNVVNGQSSSCFFDIRLATLDGKIKTELVALGQNPSN